MSLAGEVPFIEIQPHEKLGHTPKTINSRRSVPLVGMALWGATRAMDGKSGGWLFPRYASDGLVKGIPPPRRSTSGSKGYLKRCREPTRKAIVSATLCETGYFVQTFGKR